MNQHAWNRGEVNMNFQFEKLKEGHIGDSDADKR